jgi:hypothetical protein
MRKAEFLDLLLKDPKEAIEKLTEEPRFNRHAKRFVERLASTALRKAGAAGNAAVWR